MTSSSSVVSRSVLPRTLFFIATIGFAGVLIEHVTGRDAARAAQEAASPEEHFKYGSVGIEDEEGLPYWIWQVLPRMFPEKLPGPGGYASLGFVWEKGRELPVGFAKKDLFGGPRVAINCAFCHTAAYRKHVSDPVTLVPGGPSHQADPQAYVRFLQACAEDPRFTAGNILAAIDELTDLSWTQSLAYRLFIVRAVQRALRTQQGEYAWMNTRPAWGKGRIDPFNPVKYRILTLPVDRTIGNSDMVPIWNMRARQGMSLHWDGLSASLREVVLSSAIGDGASRSSIDLPSLKRIEDWLQTLPAAPYPYDVDATLAAAGRAVYGERCAACHAPGGANTGTVVRQEDVGTDRHRLDMWTQAAADAYNAYATDYPWGFKGFRKTNGYVAVPLDGVWLRAPYLHNGSVPYLAELFEPVERRTKVFYRGYTLYDPARVGFVSEGADAMRAGTKFDTSLPGNSAAGHTYGVGLAPAQKRALVEYLKTL